METMARHVFLMLFIPFNPIQIVSIIYPSPPPISSSTIIFKLSSNTKIIHYSFYCII